MGHRPMSRPRVQPTGHITTLRCANVALGHEPGAKPARNHDRCPGGQPTGRRRARESGQTGPAGRGPAAPSGGEPPNPGKPDRVAARRNQHAVARIRPRSHPTAARRNQQAVARIRATLAPAQIRPLGGRQAAGRPVRPDPGRLLRLHRVPAGQRRSSQSRTWHPAARRGRAADRAPRMPIVSQP